MVPRLKQEEKYASRITKDFIYTMIDDFMNRVDIDDDHEFQKFYNAVGVVIKFYLQEVRGKNGN